MINTHVEEYLDYFCGLTHSPDYAVLIKGAWGSGKTWFITRYNENLQKHNKRYLYVSLYGIGTIAEIEDSFFQQLHPILSSKAMAITGKILKGAIKAAIKIDLDGDKNSATTITSQVPDINLPDFLKDTSNCIIVFDDLERCSIQLETVLGYINHFVEHQGLKVVIVANEDEILSNNNADIYKAAYCRIKEKLIGKTLGIVADVVNAIDDFISKVNHAEANLFLRENKATIISVYGVSGYENLRNLKQSIWDFERLYSALPENAKSEKALVQRMLGCLLAFSFEIRKGSMLPTEIPRINSVYFSRLFSDKKDETKQDPLLEIIKKYEELEIHDPLPSPKFWQSFFDKGAIDKEELVQSIAQSIYFADSNTPAWVKLWHFYKLRDDEFRKVLDELERDFKKLTFDDIGVIKHIVGIFLRLSSAGLYKKSAADIVTQGKQYINKLQTKHALKQNRKTHQLISERDSYAGLQFMACDSPEFKEFCDYIEKAVELSAVKNMPDAGKDLLDIMSNDFDRFVRMIVESHSEDLNYYEIPIFKYISPSKFVRAYMKLEPENMRRTAFVFENRYKDSFYINKVLDELPWLKSIRELLAKEAAKRRGKVSGYMAKAFVESYVDKIIPKLEQKTTNTGVDPDVA